MQMTPPKRGVQTGHCPGVFMPYFVIQILVFYQVWPITEGLSISAECEYQTPGNFCALMLCYVPFFVARCTFPDQRPPVGGSARSRCGPSCLSGAAACLPRSDTAA